MTPLLLQFPLTLSIFSGQLLHFALPFIALKELCNTVKIEPSREWIHLYGNNHLIHSVCIFCVAFFVTIPAPSLNRCPAGVLSPWSVECWKDVCSVFVFWLYRLTKADRPRCVICSASGLYIARLLDQSKIVLTQFSNISSTQRIVIESKVIFISKIRWFCHHDRQVTYQRNASLSMLDTRSKEP